MIFGDVSRVEQFDVSAKGINHDDIIRESHVGNGPIVSITICAAVDRTNRGAIIMEPLVM